MLTLRRQPVLALLVRLKAAGLTVRRELGEGYVVHEARHVNAACKLIGIEKHHLVLADAKLPPWDLEVLQGCAGPAATVTLVEAHLEAGELALMIEAHAKKSRRPAI